MVVLSLVISKLVWPSRLKLSIITLMWLPLTEATEILSFLKMMLIFRLVDGLVDDGVIVFYHLVEVVHVEFVLGPENFMWKL